MCLEYFPGTGIREKNITDKDVEGIYLNEKSKNKVDNEYIPFCHTCGIGDHTSSECPHITDEDILINENY